MYRLFLARVAVMRAASSSASGRGSPASYSRMPARFSKYSFEVLGLSGDGGLFERLDGLHRDVAGCDVP
jgi:hypothetical protein